MAGGLVVGKRISECCIHDFFVADMDTMVNSCYDKGEVINPNL